MPGAGNRVARDREGEEAFGRCLTQRARVLQRRQGDQRDHGPERPHGLRDLPRPREAHAGREAVRGGPRGHGRDRAGREREQRRRGRGRSVVAKHINKERRQPVDGEVQKHVARGVRHSERGHGLAQEPPPRQLRLFRRRGGRFARRGCSQPRGREERPRAAEGVKGRGPAEIFDDRRRHGVRGYGAQLQRGRQSPPEARPRPLLDVRGGDDLQRRQARGLARAHGGPRAQQRRQI
mmetsp:Transcript_18503/g.55014  ORF Transcript_18503/g.55014 Transcript_18503/m.55014 type:complete len:236 (-) Transcript_18503:441-1148(-)